MNATLGDIAQMLKGVVVGDNSLTIASLSPIDNIAPGSIVYADGSDNLKLAEASMAAAVVVGRGVSSDKKPLIQVEQPFQAFITLLHHFNPAKKSEPSIHPTAVIADNVKLGKGVSIGPYVVIESGCNIGDRCVLKSHVYLGQEVQVGEETVLHPQVTIYDHCRIGSRVSIHASSVIGSDGFGYTFVEDKHVKIPHIGNVIIEDDVEIGANTVVDRATLGSTIIGAGSKIDNLVQIAHSVKLGKNNIICAFTGIAGSSSSGNNVIFAANVGVSDHVRIDDNVILGARAGVPPKKHLLAGNVYLGNPARPRDKAIEQELSVTRIPIMRKNLKNLSEKVAELSEKIAKYEEE